MKKNVLRYASLLCALVMLCSSLTMLGGCMSNEDAVEQSDKAYVSIEDVASDVKVVDEKTAVKAVIPYAESLGLTDPEKELKVVDVSSVGEYSYYRMQQTYQGVPVYGRTIVLSADKKGNADVITANSVAVDNNINVTPSAKKENIDKEIKDYFVENYADIDPEQIEIDEYDESDLIIYQSDNEAFLAYVIYVGFNELIIDAHTGKVFWVSKTVDEATATCYNADASESFEGYNDGKKYVAENKKRGITIYNYLGKDSELQNDTGEMLKSSDKFFGNVVNGDTTEKDKNYNDGASFMNNLSAIYDYFNKNFSEKAYGEMIACYNDGYDSGNNALGGSYNGKGYLSMGSVMGVNAIDTMAHEYTHIVSRRLVSWEDIPSWSSLEDQSGAINEGFSDIFGELIEAALNNEEPDWEHGSRIIYDPMSNNYPAKVGDRPFESFTAQDGQMRWGMPTGDSYYTDYSHGFSTIISHAAYLMWNGIDGTISKTISEEQLAELWYRALLLLQSDATFSQCASAVLSAAQQMHEENPSDFSAEKIKCVQEAFERVGITAKTSLVWVERGAKVFVMDATNKNFYDNYHIVIEKINLRTRKEEVVGESDVTDTKGYALDFPEGEYIITVSDNAENGSDYTFSKVVKVIETSQNTPEREPTISISTADEVRIDTNFKMQIPVKDFTIPTEKVVTLGELSVIEPEISPVDSTSYSIKWTSSDESVATVTPTGENGIITTLKKGTTTITAELTSGGKTITKTTELRVASKGRDTVLVLDISGSMSGEPLEEMKEAAIQFCNDLLKDEYNNRVGLVFYETDITTVDLTDDLDMLISRIRSVSTTGVTNMEGGLAAANTMLQKNGKTDSVKNVVIMADGLPNEGKTSFSGSMPDAGLSFDTSYNDMYSNAVIDTAKDMMSRYNLYSLGFFHNMDSESKKYASTLMKELTNQKDGYYQVDNAADLKFAFGDIQEEISVGSKIVINIACPVDVKVTYNGEILSSASDSFKDTASFGSLQLLGKNKDIKVVSLDSDKNYDIELTGTGEGQMDYSVSYFDEAERMTDHRSFEAVPITPTTVIKSDTDTEKKDITLDVDIDGDGETDTIWTAAKKSKGTITYEKNPPVAEEASSVSDDNVLIYAIVGVMFVFVLMGGMAAVLLGTRGKTKDQDFEVKAREIEKESRTQETEEKERSGATIQITNGSMNGFAVPIHDGETLHIGKDGQFANIVLSRDYGKVSRMHCSITYDAANNWYYVTDCSSNGVYYANKTRFVKGRRTLVRANTVLMLGDEECTIWLS